MTEENDQGDRYIKSERSIDGIGQAVERLS